MDFLTDILIAFVFAVICYYLLKKVIPKISDDNAITVAAFLGGWLFTQFPKYTYPSNSESDSNYINTVTTLRSYFVGIVFIAWISTRFLGGTQILTTGGPMGSRISFRK